MPDTRLVFYVSGHGFGHAARTIEVINALAEQRSQSAPVVRTNAPRWLFELTARRPVEFHSIPCDTGVWQLDSLRLDEAKTLRDARSFYASFDARVESEAAFLRQTGARLVVADMPPLAFAAAARAEIPSIALGNFTWDWIYADYLEREGAAGSSTFLPQVQHAYAQAALVLRLPMWGGFEAFRCPIVDIPFVARRSQRDPLETKAALGLPDDRPIVLVSFGGYDIRSLDLEALAALRRYAVVMMGLTRPDADFSARSALTWVVDQELYARGFRYEDVVRAAEVVITKPGYGIVAECLANDAAVLYTSRGRFREYDVLVEAMPRFLRCRFITHADLCAGRWEPALDALLSSPSPRERPRADGARVAADRILTMME